MFNKSLPTLRRHVLTSAVVGVMTAHTSFAQVSNEPEKAARKKAPTTIAPQKLSFGLITPRNADVTLKNWNPFIDRMAKAAGVTIESRTYSTQGELIKDYLSGQLDLAWLGNAPALEIVESG